MQCPNCKTMKYFSLKMVPTFVRTKAGKKCEFMWECRRCRAEFGERPIIKVVNGVVMISG